MHWSIGAAAPRPSPRHTPTGTFGLMHPELNLALSPRSLPRLR